MQTFYLGVACFLLLTMIVGLIRVFRGPRQEDRLVAVQLFGTTGVAVLLLLAAAFDAPAMRNTAMVFAVLAVLAVMAFVRGSREHDGRGKGRDSGGGAGG
ncbi:monovalent cation/H+ antiporter complex subunit F [Desulfonatronum lacustre]|uniref:monovalent cation/H+ antiporter complex subunit F n=1 Tax=Desulfonatronum lacustre TaxID=66849 RepID=UPI00048D023D|nr:monovalent cation/H+ antiporter complex subunit F [Desulfonatronum lacustre]SMP65838.1 multisubunit sodium/proton antiporter, MrpF subunit [Desulfonatronum zhilinae]